MKQLQITTDSPHVITVAPITWRGAGKWHLSTVAMFEPTTPVDQLLCGAEIPAGAVIREWVARGRVIARVNDEDLCRRCAGAYLNRGILAVVDDVKALEPRRTPAFDVDDRGAIECRR